MSNVVGGLGNAAPADEKAQSVADKVKADAEAKAGRKFDAWKAVKVATQVVAGVNYFLKVDAGDKHVHLRVWQKLDGTHELSDMQDGKTADDALEYF